MQDVLSDKVYRYLVALALTMLAIGTTFYHYFEKFSWIDAYYFSVVTLATVGYGDLSPQTDGGKIFTTFFILTGVGIVGTFISYSLRRRAQKAQDKRQNKNQSQS